MAFQLGLGCRTVGYVQEHRTCCGRCVGCFELWGRYGYTQLALSGVAGGFSLLPTPSAFPGFAGETMSVPNLSQGGFCDDSIFQDRFSPGGGVCYFNASDPVKWVTNEFDWTAQVRASVAYNCFGNVPSRSIGVLVSYYVTGDVYSQFSQAAFPDWDFYSLFPSGLEAYRYYGPGVQAYWRWALSFGGIYLLSGEISHTEFDLSAGNAPVTSLTIPAMPYDYLGIIQGTVTIS